MQTISDRLRLLLEKSELEQKEIAVRLGVNEKTIRNYKTGKTTKIPSDFINKAAKFFGVSASWLYDGEQEEQIERCLTMPSL